MLFQGADCVGYPRGSGVVGMSPACYARFGGSCGGPPAVGEFGREKCAERIRHW